MDNASSSRGSPVRVPDFSGLSFDVVTNMVMNQNPGLLSQKPPTPETRAASNFLNAGLMAGMKPPTPEPHRGAPQTLEESFANSLDSAAKPNQETSVTSANGEQSQSSLLQLWWALIQDQMASSNREIESLRRANSQLEARQSQIVQFLSEQQGKSGELRQGFAAHQECVQELLANERISREQQIRGAVSEVRDIIADQKVELNRLVRETCEKERDQTKSMLARARQILDSDESLRVRLQSLLHTEMVSKADFTEVTDKIWGEVKAIPGTRIRSKSPINRQASSIQAPASCNIPVVTTAANHREHERSHSPGRMLSARGQMQRAMPLQGPLLSATPAVQVPITVVPSPKTLGLNPMMNPALNPLIPTLQPTMQPAMNLKSPRSMAHLSMRGR